MRVLSGIQPTGRFHLGNYFGAIRQYIELQHHDQAFYFIADLHALTTIRDKKQLQELTQDAALDLLALGLDPEQATLFRQSDVPEVTELTWLLMTVTQMSLLEKCHAYKDKIAKGLAADAGLFTYPVLMAADILAYDSNLVPVGQDQVQHLEVTRDIAQRFNHIYETEVFVLPEGHVLEETSKVPGTDGEKMSKSYNNTIGIFEAPKKLRKKFMSIKTDSTPVQFSISTNSSRMKLNNKHLQTDTVQAEWDMAMPSKLSMRKRWTISPKPENVESNSSRTLMTSRLSFKKVLKKHAKKHVTS